MPIWDKEGNEYRVECTMTGEKLIEWRVFDPGPPWIGVAACARKASDLRIHDLRLRDDLPGPRTFLQGLFGRPAPRVTYQRRGLGTELLKLVIGYAETSRCETISGDITVEDIAANPRLVQWYQHHGFAFSPAHAVGRLAGNITRPVDQQR